MPITSIILSFSLLASFVLGGCATNQSGSTRDGFNTRLPIANMRAIVWGNHPATVAAATAWLQKVGLTIIAQEKLQQDFDETRIPQSDLTIEEAGMLQAANQAKADYLVIVDTIMTPSMVLKRVDQESFQDENGTNTVTVQKLSVSIRGINVETNTVDWSGLASYPEVISGIDQKLRALTWDVLGVAWGVQTIYTAAELRELKNYQLMTPAIDTQVFPGGMQ